jgi:osmotically-inducible protein OsmY
VTLNGTVNSRDDQRRAEDIADHVSAVKHVQNNLRVQSQAAVGESTRVL